MRLPAVMVLIRCTTGAAWAQSPLAGEIRALASRYHEDPARIDTLRADMTRAAGSDPQVENRLALAQIAFLYGDIRATTPDEKPAAYEQGRQAARRAAEVRKGMETALELDPRFPPAYALAGTVYYEVPGLLGGDLEKSEALFRRGLEVDPRFTGLRLGLARTLIKRGRIPEARREPQAVLDEQAPGNVADWTLEDAPEARALPASLAGRS